MPLWYDAAMNKKTSIEFDPVTRVDLDPVMMQTRRSNQSARRTLAVAALLALIFVILHADNLVAQSSIRYELGSRLRRFEARFENHLDDGGRKLVLESMSGAVSSFFGMQMQDAAQGLDQAWIKLWPAEQRATAEWVASRQVRAANHLLDESGTVTLQISEYYPGEFAMPANGKFVCDLESLTLADVDSGVKRVGEFQLSQTELKLPGLAAEPGDYAIRVSVQSGDNLFPVGRVVCSRLLRFEQRMEALEAKRKSLRQRADAGEVFDASAIATLKDRIYLLRRWAKSSDLETDFLACLELRRLEALGDNMEQPNWLYETSLATRSGQKILPGQAVTIAGEKRKKAVVRLFVPDAVFEEPEQAAERSKRERPVVIALHGAGGSENMFFDGYGDGKVVKLCEQRGWILVSPRIGLGGVGLGLPEIIEQLSEQFPIDKNAVFVVGHSMGAAYANQVAAEFAASDTMQSPGVAALGGGRRIRLAAEGAPAFFVAAGSHDFGKRGAQSLSESLKSQSIPCDYHEYSNTEHMGIVQVALSDVFQFFDGLLQ